MIKLKTYYCGGVAKLSEVLSEASLSLNSKPSLLLFIGGTSAYKDASINSFVNVGH